MQQLHWFLGSNTPKGFVGYVDTVYDSSWRVWLIKGGPGCGKSGLMRRVADNLPGKWELVHCSSDPRSLDAVFDRDQKVLLADATAPHAIEPRWPGCCETLIDLSAGFCIPLLRQQAKDITALKTACACQHRQAQALLGAARQLCRAQQFALPEVTANAARQLALQYLDFLPDSPCHPSRQATEHRRGLTALTPEGILFFADTVRSLAYRIYLLQDEAGLGAQAVMGYLYQILKEQPIEIITCRCSLFSNVTDPPEQILLPEQNIAFIHDRPCHRWQPLTSDRVQVIPVSTIFTSSSALQQKTAYPYSHLQRSWLQAATNCMRQAKQLHEELEQYYIHAMDFSFVDAAFEKVARDLTDH